MSPVNPCKWVLKVPTNVMLFYNAEERKLSICLQVMLRGTIEGRLPGCCWGGQRLAERVLLPEVNCLCSRSGSQVIHVATSNHFQQQPGGLAMPPPAGCALLPGPCLGASTFCPKNIHCKKQFCLHQICSQSWDECSSISTVNSVNNFRNFEVICYAFLALVISG